jgi:integrase
MASVTKRGDSWLVRVIRKGHEPVNKTFSTKRDAEAFAAVIESEIARGVYRRAEGERVSFREILERYKLDVTPAKRGAAEEAGRITTLLNSGSAACAMLDKTLGALSPSVVAKWRDKRTVEVAPATLLREWAIFSHALEVARIEWGYAGLLNPFRDVRKPRVMNQRNRRVSPEELDAIVSASGSAELSALVCLAIETGARRGELLAICWRDIDLKRRVAQLKTGETKNGHGRALPLSPVACALLQSIPKRLDGGTVFTMRPDSVTQAFRRAMHRARKAYELECVKQSQQPDAGYLVGIKWHDTRHEACSRLAERGLSTTELAAISGHRTIQLLARYVHHRPEQLAERLAASY